MSIHYCVGINFEILHNEFSINVENATINLLRIA